MASRSLTLALLCFLSWVNDTQANQFCQTPSNQSIASVNLGYAQYQGTVLGNGVAQYLGMRFASPPTGDLRWRAPVAPETVEGSQAADAFGKICLGISQTPGSTIGEDCLFANVWAPTNATEASRLPVWLFIQGGGYTGNANANYNGSEIVEKSGGNVVFVNFNYRVGLYGFLASERVRDDGDLNVGLLDQRMMMTWVKNNIAQFGGNPDHVTIHGVSAGAGSVALHMVANGGVDEKLFHGAIGDSTFFPAQPLVSELEWQMDLVLSQTGCNNTDTPMECLRSLDESSLQATNVPSPFPGRTSLPLPLFYWTPCIDGKLLQDYPYVMYENDKVIKVPAIFGTCTNEGSYFAANASSEEEVTNFLQNNYPGITDAQAADIMSYYPLLPPVDLHAAWFPTASLAYGESTFVCPTVQVLNSELATQQNSTQTKLWSYRYNVADPAFTAAGLGVPHVSEIWAIFGPDNVHGAPASYYTSNAPLVPLVMDYWTSFVRILDPNVFSADGAPFWDTWEGTGDFLAFGGGQRLKFEMGNTTMEVVPDDELTRCELWKSLANVTEQ